MAENSKIAVRKGNAEMMVDRNGTRTVVMVVIDGRCQNFDMPHATFQDLVTCVASIAGAVRGATEGLRFRHE